MASEYRSAPPYEDQLVTLLNHGVDGSKPSILEEEFNSRISSSDSTVSRHITAGRNRLTGFTKAALEFLTSNIDKELSPSTPTLFRLIIAFRGLLLHIIKYILESLTPTITYRYLSKPPQKLRPTAYLDGLRGIAALIVTIFHFNIDFFPSLRRGYGSSAADLYFFQLPILRILMGAKLMVQVFFCISGYVLSYNSLRLSHSRQYTPLLKNLSSAFFRRWIRLMLPCVASTIIFFFLVYFRLLHPELPSDWRNPFAKPAVVPRGWPTPIGFPTFKEQLQDWIKHTMILTNPWRFGKYYQPPYNPVLWTIQLELIGSFIVYAIALALAMARPKAKLCVLALLVLHISSREENVYLLFVAGMFIAQMDVMRSHASRNGNSPSADSSNEKSHSSASTVSKLWGKWPYLTFISAMYVSARPDNSAETPGFRTLCTIAPPWWNPNDTDAFWPTIGAILIVFSLSRSPPLRKVFEMRWAQYLGEISFALYLLHLMFIQSAAKWLIPRCIRLVGSFVGGPKEGEHIGDSVCFMGILMGLVVLVPGLFWASDVFTTVVDHRAIMIARGVDEWVRVDDNKEVE